MGPGLQMTGALSEYKRVNPYFFQVSDILILKYAYAIYCDFYSCKNDTFQMRNHDLYFCSKQNVGTCQNHQNEGVLTKV